MTIKLSGQISDSKKIVILHDASYCYREGNPCYGVQNINITVHKKKHNRTRKRKKFKIYKYTDRQLKTLSPITDNIFNDNDLVAKRHSSMPELFQHEGHRKPQATSSDVLLKKPYQPYKSNFVVNLVSDIKSECQALLANPLTQARWRVYRCQLSSNQESCCCSCNSDAMFEVMKGLYDCYKRKTCDNCDCILCGHLPSEERRQGELRKSAVAIETTKVKGKKKAAEKEIKTKEAKVGKTAAEKEQISKDLAKVPSKKLKAAKAAGLLTPLEGKTPAQKEKIIRGLLKEGLPLPEAKTASEKKLIEKIRAEAGLPPESKTPSLKEKQATAKASEILRRIEGKSLAEKEKILKEHAKTGHPLPEGRTPSEKALIKKIRDTVSPPGKIPSEKLKAAKAAGLLTPLEGKTPAQKEKIIKGLVKHGLPLPEAKTASEQKIIDKVRAEVGLPPEPKTASLKEIHAKAKAAGILTPLEGKTLAQKENILKAQAEMGLVLPEGRTPSEKALIKKIKATVGPPSKIAPGKVPPGKLPSGKFQAALPPEQRKKLDEKTAKVAKDSKGPSDECICGLLTPDSEKVSKKKSQALKAKQITSEKLKAAKAAGLLTPLEGKTPAQKEKIIKGLLKQGLPLPEAKTASEKKLIEKIRAEAGLPPESKTPSLKEKQAKAKASDILTRLEGKTLTEKEKILKEHARMGKPLPEGRTPSEKALIKKVKSAVGAVQKIPSEKLKAAKAAGHLTPLEGKTPEQKEKIIKGLVKHGIPIPEAKTASEQKIIDKVRAEVGLPPEPKTASLKEIHAKAKAAGILTPLEGKTLAQKEKILKAQAEMGLVLPEGRTPSEKALIKKIKATVGPPGKIAPGKVPSGKFQAALPPEQRKKLDEKTAKVAKDGKGPSDECICGLLTPDSEKVSKKKSQALKAKQIPSEKLKAAKAAGLLTPLQGKTPAQKEKIIKGLLKQGLPLPEAKTASEKKLIEKIRAEAGLPPESKTPSLKEKQAKAKASDILTRLEGKTLTEKEKILKEHARMGKPLPEGRTPSEKALIKKVKSAVGAVQKIPSEKLKAAKAAGHLTPLEGKTPEQKEKIIKGLIKHGLPLPEAKTASEQKIIDKVRAEVGLPPEPKTASLKEMHARAKAAGILTPLEGKTLAQKEKILKEQAKMGLPLPEGRTPSEKALIKKIKATVGPPGKTPPGKVPSGKFQAALPPEQRKKLDEKTAKVAKDGKGPSDECICGLLTPDSEKVSKKKSQALKAKQIPSDKLKAAKAAGLLTPLEGKTQAQKEKIVKNLIKQGLPLPDAKTTSEQKLFDKVRGEVGLPPEPKTASLKEIHARAKAAGILTPLEGKTLAQKEKILKAQAEMGLVLPEGRTPSEKALIKKIRATVGPPGKIASGKIPSEKLKAAKAAGLLTPLEGKTPAQKEKIFKNLIKQGLPLPEAKTASERKLIDKVRADVGLPPEPKTASLKEMHARAKAAGILTPLEGKTLAQKEKILKEQAKMGLPLPEGRTPSEKALIKKIKATVGPPGKIAPGKVPSGKFQAALPPEQRKKLDEKTAKVAKDGKGPSDECICGLLTPDSEKVSKKKSQALKAKQIPSEKLKAAKAAGLLTPLQGKTPAQKEKIIKGLLKQGLPLPEAKTASEKKLIEKIRAEAGLPPESKTPSLKEKQAKAKASDILTRLEGKTLTEKEKILKEHARMGKPLPEGRTPSEKALIKKVKSAVGAVQKIPSEKLKAAKAAGHLTPLEGKTPEQKEKIIKGLIKHGLPLPEAKTASEQKIIDKVRAEVGLPPEPKTASLKEMHARAKAAGILTPLEGKTLAQKEKILKEQAKMGLPLPEGRTPSEKALIKKIKATVGPPGKIAPGKVPSGKFQAALPPEQRKKLDEKTAKVAKDGKGPSDECICGLLTPDSEKVSKKKSQALKAKQIPSEKLKAAKAAGLLTPLQGKTPAQKEKIIKGLLKQGLPLPEAKTASEKKLIEKIRAEAGLPPESKTPSLKEKQAKAKASDILTRLEGKTLTEKEKILKEHARMGKPLPEGRTPSEKALIKKVKSAVGAVQKIPSEKLKAAKAAGHLTPLEGKSPEQKEKIIKGLVKHGIPLPEAKTASEQKIIDKVRAEVGLPPEPKTASLKEIHAKAKAAGILTPLEGKTLAQKEKILKAQAEMGLVLPEGRTPSEKALIKKIKATVGPPGKIAPGKVPSGKFQAALPPEQRKKLDEKTAKATKDGKGPSDECICGLLTPDSEKVSKKKSQALKAKQIPSEKLKAAKAAGLLTPLEGKTPAQKEKIIKGLLKQGLPLPEAKTASEKKLIEKIRAEAGLPPESKTPSLKEKQAKAKASDILTRLEGKTLTEKEKILKEHARMGKPLPEGRTPSEKALIKKVKSAVGAVQKIPSEKLKAAKAAGLLTPLEGKTPAQKEKIIKGLLKQGLPLPEGKTASEKKLIEKIRADAGLPPEKQAKAKASDILTRLEGKSLAEKEKILKEHARMGMPLPEGRTPSEKALIKKVKSAVGPIKKIPSEKLKAAKAAGLLTPLEGKTPAQKEKIIRGLLKQGLPLPEAKTASEKKLIEKIRAEAGLPPTKEKHAKGEPGPKPRKQPMAPPSLPPEELKKLDQKTAKVTKDGKGPSDECICPLLTPESERKGATVKSSDKLRKAKAAGLLTPLEGKTPEQKERILRGLAEAGLPIPEGKTASERALIKKMRAEKKESTKWKKKEAKPIPGITEEFEDVIKTTKCDRGCGCDKKKIRFKHSYVKIRVTSPDLSSCCPCPEECLPGVKGGIFTDNEGIKVTVGSAIGVPSYSINLAKDETTIDSLNLGLISKNPYDSFNFLSNQSDDTVECIMCYSSQYNSSSEESLLHNSGLNYEHYQASHKVHYESISHIDSKKNIMTDFEKQHESLICTQSLCDNETPVWSTLTNAGSNVETILIVKTESSLSLATGTYGTEVSSTISVISFVDSCFTASSSMCTNCSKYDYVIDNTDVKNTEYFPNEVDYNTVNYSASDSISDLNKSNKIENSKHRAKEIKRRNNDVFLLRLSEKQLSNNNDTKYKRKNLHSNSYKPIVVIYNLSDERDIVNMINTIISNNSLSDSSSIFVVVPTYDDDYECATNDNVNLVFNRKERFDKCLMTPQIHRSSVGLKITKKAKISQGNVQITSKRKDEQTMYQTHTCNNSILVMKDAINNKFCQAIASNKNEDTEKCFCVSTDTTEDRPCCCSPDVTDKPQHHSIGVPFIGSVVSELITPIIAKQGAAQGLHQEAYLNVPELKTQTRSLTMSNKPAMPIRICSVPPRPCGQDIQCLHDSLNKLHEASQTLAKAELCNQPTKMTTKSTGCPGEIVRATCKIPPCNTPKLPPMCNNPKLTPILKPNPNPNLECPSCKPLVLRSQKKMSCFCSGKGKSIKLKTLCPCEEHHVVLKKIEKKTKSCQCCICEDAYGAKDMCKCKDKKRKKKVICECPPYEEIEWVDPIEEQKKLNFMKSEMTQTTSGFKFLVKAKQPLEEEMSFEDALEYFAEHPDEVVEKVPPKGIDCVCPPGEEIPDPINGLKVSICGKGSGSTGLSGVCCFDMLQSSNHGISSF